MKKSIFALLGVCALFVSTGYSEEPLVDLSAKEAAKLVSLKANVPLNALEISFIVEGSAKGGDGFEVKHVRRVAALHAVRDDGLASRRLLFYDLFWNEALGWFMWERREERSGDAVYIWSERLGAIVNR